METALAVLLTALAFVWTGDDDEKQDNSINIECNINADTESEPSDRALTPEASTAYNQKKPGR